MAPSVLCLYEDRPWMAPGLALLLESLARHAADLPVRLAATEHVLRRLPRRYAARRVAVPADCAGWNVKPRVLLDALRDGAPAAIWLDTDIVLAGDPRPRLARDGGGIVVADEVPWGGNLDGGARARAWDLTPRRRFAVSVNTAAIRVTGAHATLLRAWAAALDHPAYRAAQALPWRDRPALFHGDQDALTAILSAAPFDDVPVAILRRGRDIVHAIGRRGATTRQRLRAIVRGLPPLVHGQGMMPWATDRAGLAPLDAALLDTSPYTLVAARTARMAGLPAPWAHGKTRLGRALVRATSGAPALAGLPLALAVDLRLG